VVSSLWNVSDPATSVLMEEFYEQLWVKKKSPLAAMRAAQLAVLKDPDRVRKREKELREPLKDHGVSDAELRERGIQPKARKGERPPAKGERSPVAWWAAFVLSGRP
jgi:CHAT domain-containing protein